MKLFPSLDQKDRRLLIGCLVAVLVLAFVTAFLSRNENSDDNPVPSIYTRPAATARAPPLSCFRQAATPWSGGNSRSSDLAARADGQTVVIFAEPTQADIAAEDLKAVRDIRRARGPCSGYRVVGRKPRAQRKRSAAAAVPVSVQARAAGPRSVGRLRRSVDGSRSRLGPRPPARSRAVQLRRRAGGRRVRRRQGPRSSGGPAPRRSKTAPSAAPIISTSFSMRLARAMVTTFIGTNRSMAKSRTEWFYASGPA